MQRNRRGDGARLKGTLMQVERHHLGEGIPQARTRKAQDRVATTLVRD